MKLKRYTIQTQTNSNLDICYTPRAPPFLSSLSHPPFIFRMLPSFHYQLHKVFNTPLTNVSSYSRPSFTEVCTATEEKSHFEKPLSHTTSHPCVRVHVGFNWSTVNALAWKCGSLTSWEVLRHMESHSAHLVSRYCRQIHMRAYTRRALDGVCLYAARYLPKPVIYFPWFAFPGM